MRGTPTHVRPRLLRLVLVVAAVFLAFPALVAPVLQSFKGAERFPPALTYALVLGGAGAWALASFTASSAWLSLGLAATLAGGMHHLSTALGLVHPDSVLPAAAPLLVAGVLSAPALASLDPVLILGLLAGVGHKGLAHFRDTARVEVFALLTLGVVALLTSPGLVGYTASRGLSPLSTSCLQLPAAVLALLLAIAMPSVPSFLIAGLTLALLVARALSKAPEPTENARQNARASHWLLAGVLATLAVLLTFELDDTTSPAALTAFTFVLVGTGIAVLSTSFLAATARVWGPVRSGEYQMVTLDFLALCGYFVAPLLFVAYLGLQQLLPALPALVPAAVGPHVDKLRALLQPFLLSYPLAPAAALALLVVATQEAFEESSILWAHWLVPTYTLGALDTKHVALVVRLESLVDNLPPGGEATLPAVLKDAGLPLLNIFVSPTLATTQASLCQALAQNGHVLGLETAAGPFALPWAAMRDVSAGVDALKPHVDKDVAWYMGTGGHRNPWALWRASTLKLHFIAPAHRVVLGDNAGVALCALLDPWCKGGIVHVDMGSRKHGDRVHLAATLKDLKERAEEGGYVLDALSAVCPEVAHMHLPVEGVGE